jgi:predicted glycoside hydrolase/deacetylase ChbG (UPF0249 family)
MKTITLALGLALMNFNAFSAEQTPPPAGESAIRLLVREDDMGSFHAANLACIECYTNGIARSVELMVNGPWFPEAVKLLNEHPGLDVGIHLVLTSEWQSMKWGPKSFVPSLVDSNGFFFPMVWPNNQLPPRSSIQESNWKLSDIEKELRAQIETALRNVPRITHMGGHMGFEGLKPEIRDLVERLRVEYHLQPGTFRTPLKHFAGWGAERTPEGRIRMFIQNLEKLTPGTYIFVEHPAVATPEIESIGHKGYENVAADRDAVRRVYTSPEVKAAIRRLGIKLISYKDLEQR